MPAALLLGIALLVAAAPANGMTATPSPYAAATSAVFPRRAANATRAAATSRAMPSSNAAGGIAARSAGVREIGAGIQRVSDTSASPSTAALATKPRQAKPTPSRAKARAAASATAGISGSTYCGSLE